MKCFASIVLSIAGLVPAAASAQARAIESFVDAPGPMGPMRPLKGTLLEPRSGAAPVLLIVPGSGPTDRDGNNPMGVKAASYRLLAKALAARGIASLRFDKRGMFASAGAVKDANAVTIADYGADLQAWVDTLMKRQQAPCAWILGHSEGGLVALAAAKELRGACGYILVAAPGRPMGALLREQLKANPANGPILGQALPAIDALEQGRRVDTQGMHPALLPLFNPAVQGFLISAFAYDPAQLVSAIQRPVLVLQGQRDLQVSTADARALARANPRASLVLLPNVNHVLKAVASDDPQANMAAYADASLPLAPGVAEAIASFIEGASTRPARPGS